MEDLEEIALDTAKHKPTKLLRYFDNNSVVCLKGQQDYSNFFTLSTALDVPPNTQWKLKRMILSRS
jgi:hypothetical protein